MHILQKNSDNDDDDVEDGENILYRSFSFFPAYMLYDTMERLLSMLIRELGQPKQ